MILLIFFISSRIPLLSSTSASMSSGMAVFDGLGLYRPGAAMISWIFSMLCLNSMYWSSRSEVYSLEAEKRGTLILATAFHFTKLRFLLYLVKTAQVRCGQAATRDGKEDAHRSRDSNVHSSLSGLIMPPPVQLTVTLVSVSLSTPLKLEALSPSLRLNSLFSPFICPLSLDELISTERELHRRRRFGKLTQIRFPSF